MMKTFIIDRNEVFAFGMGCQQLWMHWITIDEDERTGWTCTRYDSRSEDFVIE